MERKKQNKYISILLAALLPLLLLISWQVLSEGGHINQSILPSPSKIIAAFDKLIKKGTYSKHILASLDRVVKGFLIGSAFGLFIGTITALIPVLDNLLSAIIGIFRPIPPIAAIPFFILALGIGESSKVAIIVIGSFWPAMLNTYQGIKSTDRKLLELARAFEKDQFSVLVKIIIPSAIPSIFTGLRLGIGSAWTCVVAAEMIAASAGIGYLISYGRELAQPDVLLVGIVTIGIVGIVLDILMRWLEKKLIFWNDVK